MKTKLLVLAMSTALFTNNAYAQATQTTTTTTTTNQNTTVPQQEVQPVQEVPVAPVVPATPATPAAPAPAVAAADNSSGSSENSMPRFYIGARIFGAASKFKVNTVENNNVTVAQTTTTLGYGYGGYLGYNFSKNFALNLEVIYTTIAQKYKDRGLDRRIDITYFNVPLMLVLNTNISKPVNFNIAAGPQVGINTGAKLSSSSQGNTTVVNSKFAVKATDFGFAYGAGLDFRVVPALSIGVGYRGVIGLVDISDKNSTATYTTTDNNGVTTTQTVVVLDKSKVRSYGAYLGLRLNF